MADPLLTVEDVGWRLNVSKDWVWDHCSRKKPKLPFIRMGDGALRFRASAIEAFINERERLSALRRRAESSRAVLISPPRGQLRSIAFFHSGAPGKIGLGPTFSRHRN